jgi:hypothetical protein
MKQLWRGRGEECETVKFKQLASEHRVESLTPSATFTGINPQRARDQGLVIPSFLSVWSREFSLHIKRNHYVCIIARGVAFAGGSAFRGSLGVY